jgi:dynein heavy chain
LLKDFDPYRNLWVTTSDWLRWYESWMNDAITMIDAENIEKNVTESYKSMHKAIKQFQEFDSESSLLKIRMKRHQIICSFVFIKDVQHVAIEIKNQIEDFRPNIPLIQALRNPGMRNRHWEMLTEELKIPIRPKKDLNFKKCLEMGLDKHIEKISKVAEFAGKEYTIEQALDKMENEWKPIRFETLPYKQTGTYIIKASDEISQLLDDHIVMTQSMSFSPFKKAFEERILTWENKLKTTQVKNTL